MDDWRFAMIGAFLANQWRDPKEPPVRQADLVPRRKRRAEPEPERLTPKEWRERAREVHRSLGGDPDAGPRRAGPSVMALAED